MSLNLLQWEEREERLPEKINSRDSFWECNQVGSKIFTGDGCLLFFGSDNTYMSPPAASEETSLERLKMIMREISAGHGWYDIQPTEYYIENADVGIVFFTKKAFKYEVRVPFQLKYIDFVMSRWRWGTFQLRKDRKILIRRLRNYTTYPDRTGFKDGIVALIKPLIQD